VRVQRSRIRQLRRSAYRFRDSRNQRSLLDISRSRRSRQRRRYKVNCCVKREHLCTGYAHIYRQASLSSLNEPEAKPTDQTIQANQASKPSIEHAIHTIEHRIRTGGQPKNQTETNTQARARPKPTQRQPNENQTETKQHTRRNQNQTSKHPSARTFQTPNAEQYLKENRSTYGDTEAGSPIGGRGKTGRDRDSGVGFRAGADPCE
jgi:hypothetical protein